MYCRRQDGRDPDLSLRARAAKELGTCKPIWALFLLLHAASGSLVAQEIEPRSYAVVPKGMYVAGLTYTFSQGAVLVDVSSPVQDLKVTTHVISTGLVSTFSVFNKLGRLQIALPYAVLSGTAKYNGVDTAGTRNGLGDLRMKFGVNLLGSPVMSASEFVRFKEETVLGASIVVSVPVGQYDPQRLINMGTNRWGFKPEIGFSRRQGRVYLEFYTGLWIFTDNTAFLGSNTLATNPLFSFQGHVSYLFPSNIWIAVNGGYTSGGQTNLNGADQNDFQRNLRLGATLSVPLDRHQSVKLLFNTGASTSAGQDYTALSLSYQYRW